VPPRQRSDPSAQTRKRVLDTAERLFGERGVAAVSLRDINRAAGISQGVLHYHFGGRDALVEAILERSLPAINDERRRMYEALVAAGRPPQARDVIEILCLPLARMALGRQAAGRRFLRCLGRLHEEHNPVRARIADRHLADIPILDMLQTLAPAAPSPRIEWYLGMVMNVIHTTLGELGRAAQPWQLALIAEPMDPAEQVQALVDFICEGVGALA